MRLFAAHEVGGRVRKVAVKLAQIGEKEALDLAGALRLVDSVDRGVLRAVEDGAEDAQHARADELARRVLTQAVAGGTADDHIDRNDVEADIGRTVRP